MPLIPPDSLIGFVYLLGVIITLLGYAISIFGMPHLSFQIPESVYTSLNDMKVCN